MPNIHLLQLKGGKYSYLPAQNKFFSHFLIRFWNEGKIDFLLHMPHASLEREQAFQQLTGRLSLN